MLTSICTAMAQTNDKWSEVPLVEGRWETLMYTTMRCGSYTNKVLIDTGSTFTILCHEDFLHIREQGLLGKFEGNGSVNCIKGRKPLKMYRVRSINIGGFTFRNVVIYFNTDPDNTEQRLIGQDLLTRFIQIYIDNEHHKLYVKLKK